MPSDSKSDRGLCSYCGGPVRTCTAQERDGTVTTWPECVNWACVVGPSGLLTIKKHLDVAGQPASVTKFTGSGFRNVERSTPTQGEGNVEPVARQLMEAANRQFGTSYDEYREAPRNARVEAGHDCEISSSHDGYFMRLQVTRALPQDVYQRQGKLGHRDLSVTIEEAAAWVVEAVRRKATRALPDVALVLDGMDAPFIAFVTDLKVEAEHRHQLESQGWHSIWLVGITGARRVAGLALPGAPT